MTPKISTSSYLCIACFHCVHCFHLLKQTNIAMGIL